MGTQHAGHMVAPELDRLGDVERGDAIGDRWLSADADVAPQLVGED